MKCSNCGGENFMVEVEHIKKANSKLSPEWGIPVKLVCSHCKRPIKAWISNDIMKTMVDRLESMLITLYDIEEYVLEYKPLSLRERIFGRKNK